MDNNSVIITLASSLAAIVLVVGLLIKSWIDSKKSDSAVSKQCVQCALDHNNLLGELTGTQNQVKEVQKTADECKGFLTSINTNIALIKQGVETLINRP